MRKREKVIKIKKELESLCYLDYEIDSLLNEVEDMRSMVKSTNYADDKAITTYNGDLSNIIIKIEQYELKLNRMIDELINKKEYWRGEIKKLDSPYKDVLLLYYFDKKATFNDVARKLNYSRGNIMKIQREAIAKLSEIY